MKQRKKRIIKLDGEDIMEKYPPDTPLIDVINDLRKKNRAQPKDSIKIVFKKKTLGGKICE